MNKKLKNILLAPLNLLHKINPVLCTKILYRLKCGSKLNLDNPRTYNEKLNWLKLFYRNPLMPKCADKFLVREYITEKGYGQYLPRLLWYGTNVDEIPFEDLPDSFVIKSTSGSGNNIIVHNKATLDKETISKEIGKWLKEKYIPCYGEWHYSFITPMIIIEELLSDGVNYVPIDYKFFCFRDGDPMCIAVDLDRFNGHKRNIYDANFVFMPEVDFGFEVAVEATIEKPNKFEEMKEVAKALSCEFPHCRVDFYVLGDKFYIGELTFFNGAGFDLISPQEYNIKMGDWLDLPTKNHNS